MYRKIEEWKLLRVCDGDTFVVRWQGMDMRCRLMGIDAPEDGQPGVVQQILGSRPAHRARWKGPG